MTRYETQTKTVDCPSESYQDEAEQLRQWDREVYWHAFTQMAEYDPLIVDRAQGCALIDIEGREYLDAVSSLWCNVHGHRHPKIDHAIREQLDRVAHCTSLGASCTTTIRLAKRLVDIAPVGLDHVFFSDSGATAVEVALKMAFQYWRQRESAEPLNEEPSAAMNKKTRFVALNEAYHGDTLGAVSVGGMEMFHDIFRPLLFDVLRVSTPDRRGVPGGQVPKLDNDSIDETALAQFYLNELEELLAARHEEIAAVILEPLVQGAAGMIMHPSGYLAGVRALTNKYNVLMIADEVAVGVGRTGRMFACEHEDVTPDLMCVAKGITGGYLPLAATLASDEIFQAFLGEHAESKTFYHGHTYGGNPLAAAAALATLDVFEEEQTLERLPPLIEQIEQRLQRISGHVHVGDTRARGMMVGIELVESRKPLAPYPWQEKTGARVCRHARDLGVWIRPLGDVLVVMPPLAIRNEELDRIFDSVEESIDAVCGT